MTFPSSYLNNLVNLEDTSSVPVVVETNPFRNMRANRINDPAMFDGDPSKIANFIGHVKMSIYSDSARFPDEISKICFLCSFLSGYAFTWALPYLESLGSNNLDLCMSSFPLFLEEFQRSFGIVNEKLNNETQLLRLRQGKNSAAEYSANFRRLSCGSGFNEIALLGIFKEGLSEELKDALTTKDLPDQLSLYTAKVIELDNRIRDRESRRHPFRNHTLLAPRSHLAPPPGHSAVLPVEVPNGFVRKFSPLTSEEKNRRRKMGLCLYCGEEGHIASDCPKKGKVQARGL